MNELIEKIQMGQEITIYGNTRIESGIIKGICRMNESIVALMNESRQWFTICKENLHMIKAII
mgnify:CR=1 FL=1